MKWRALTLTYSGHFCLLRKKRKFVGELMDRCSMKYEVDNGGGWAPDMLGRGFEMLRVEHPDDYSGAVRSTVVRRCAQGRRADCAVLYVHGFSDYFLQDEMARMFNDAGYDFYAVDLRKYGRSLMPGQRMFEVRDLHEYFPDIDAAVEIIHSAGLGRIVLLGHSTGGLTASLYMSEHPSPLIRALILNSPFLDWNLPRAARAALPLLSALGRRFPRIPVRQKPDPGYAETLAADLGGEWSYRKEWKPDVLPDVDAGWVRAIHTAQIALRRRQVNVPVLLMHSSDSVRPGDDRAKYARADAILNVGAIARYGRRLGPDVTEVVVDNGLHDLVLSPLPVRRLVYDEMLAWLGRLGLCR